jgi:transcription elongation factor GreB
MANRAIDPPDDDADDDSGPDQSAADAGVKNYMTPRGFSRLQDELRELSRVERPKVVEVVSWAAGNGDRSENGDYIYGKKRLREIDRRIRFLSRRLETAEIIDPARQQHLEQVFFGATVSYVDEDGAAHTVTLVGVDEADMARHQVSWRAPIARALLKARAGDTVELRTPTGRQVIEVLEIRYEVPAD